MDCVLNLKCSFYFRPSLTDTPYFGPILVHFAPEDMPFLFEPSSAAAIELRKPRVDACETTENSGSDQATEVARRSIIWAKIWQTYINIY